MESHSSKGGSGVGRVAARSIVRDVPNIPQSTIIDHYQKTLDIIGQMWIIGYQ